MYETQDTIVFAIVEDTQIIPLDSLAVTAGFDPDYGALAPTAEMLTDFETMFRTKFDSKHATYHLMCRNLRGMELVLQFSTNRTIKMTTEDLLKKMYDAACPVSAVAFSYRPNTGPVEAILDVVQDPAGSVNPSIVEIILAEHQTAGNCACGFSQPFASIEPGPKSPNLLTAQHVVPRHREKFRVS
jgi:hypothetical protein